ncbi:MAG TPA: helix-turn-helix domain-containing protein [Candidatus Saccharimonadales bacterium]|nr:helix-turn-helix domain-containing protein [Candidatus Saccharimonadales bacterium]
MKDSTKSTGCLENTLCIIGDQWTALILRDLTPEAHTFSQLEASLVGISPRTLSQRLEHLVREEIVEKILYCPHPPRYQYGLTPKGHELQDVIEKMAEWGQKYQVVGVEKSVRSS